VDDRAREALAGLIARFGVSVCDDPKRCAGVMRDLLPYECRREIHVLVLALGEGIPQRLHSPSSSTIHLPVEGRVPVLASALSSEFGIEGPIAVWAVETWAMALGLIPLAPSAAAAGPTSVNAKARDSVAAAPTGGAHTTGGLADSAPVSDLPPFQASSASSPPPPFWAAQPKPRPTGRRWVLAVVLVLLTAVVIGWFATSHDQVRTAAEPPPPLPAPAPSPPPSPSPTTVQTPVRPPSEPIPAPQPTLTIPPRDLDPVPHVTPVPPAYVVGLPSPQALSEIKAMMQAGWRRDETALLSAQQRLTALRPRSTGGVASARRYNELGLTAEREGDLDTALNYYYKAFQADAMDVEIVNNFANALYRTDNIALSEKAALRAVALSPSRTNAWVLVGHARAIENDVSGAVGCYRNALRFSKNSARTMQSIEDRANERAEPGFRSALSALRGY